MGAGFDTGTKGAILTVGNDKTVYIGGKDVSAKGVSTRRAHLIFLPHDESPCPVRMTINVAIDDDKDK